MNHLFGSLLYAMGTMWDGIDNVDEAALGEDSDSDIPCDLLYLRIVETLSIVSLQDTADDSDEDDVPGEKISNAAVLRGEAASHFPHRYVELKQPFLSSSAAALYPEREIVFFGDAPGLIPLEQMSRLYGRQLDATQVLSTERAPFPLLAQLAACLDPCPDHFRNGPRFPQMAALVRETRPISPETGPVPKTVGSQSDNTIR